MFKKIFKINISEKENEFVSFFFPDGVIIIFIQFISALIE